MSRLTAWWDGLSERERFQLYSRFALEVSLGVVMVVIALTTLTTPWARAGTLLAGAAAVLSVEACPIFADWPRTGQRWIRRALGAVLVLVGAVSAFVAHTSSDATAVDDARMTGLLAALAAAVGLVPMLRRRWLVLGVLAAVVGLALGATPGGVLEIALVAAVVGGFMLTTTLLTMWGLRIVTDLEQAKSTEAALRVAEERLRFGRDLHDVVGRGFSAIAVKSELASTLERAGAHERAAGEMDEVKELAVESLEQMRSLVRGYRAVDLDAEIAGARALLSSAGCALVVEGGADAVPDRFHEVAAWVVREGATNIVRHSSATTATLTVGPHGMSLRNDAPAAAPGPVAGAGTRSGQQGLAERLATVGATMSGGVHDDEYVLEVRWPT